MEALTKEKKEKKNVLTNLELVNLKSASLFYSKEPRRSAIEAKRKEVGGGQYGVLEESTLTTCIVGNYK